MPIIAVALAAALVVGGGVSVAAQSALPGQLLYPVKVHVDENVAGAFALSNAARADWDVSLMKTRLDEAEQLAQSGSLGAGAQTDITDNFDAHLYDVGSMITKLKAAGDTADAASIAAKLKTMLAVHQELLASTSAQVSSATQTSLIPVVAELQGALGAAAVLSSSTGAQASPSDK
ncbi:MAG: hypothetical protein KGH79_00535 [Patescibacteria group bacterium]|nr:hypothetical protein [Patescibacteria group bacterium]